MHCHQFTKEKRNEQAPLDSADSTVLKCVYIYTHIYLSLIRASFSLHFLSATLFQRWWARRKETLRKENSLLKEFA